MIELSEEQRVAVDSGPVELFVGAGAGSGKTRVLSARFVKAVLGMPPYKKMPIDSVATVTFTERAAGELAERMRASLLAEGAHDESRHVDQAWISTIHGLCARIVRRNAFELGINPHFGIATEVETGEISSEAFGTAMRGLLDDGDQGVELLLDQFGASDLESAITGIHADLCSMGFGPGDVRVIKRDELVEPLLAACGTLERLGEVMTDTCRTTLMTVSRNVEVLSAAVAVLRAALIGDEAACSTLCDGMSLKRLARDEAHNEIVDEANREFAIVQLIGRQLKVRPYEEAFLRILGGFSEQFAAIKRQRGLLDFEDLQLFTVKLLESQPMIAEEYRRGFGLVMVDEFQDTNALQLKIVQLLSAGNLCTVGDDKQSIYSFRHADVRVFRRRREQARMSVSLADNYRSHPDLLGVFNGIFGSAAMFGDDFMRLQPASPAGDDGWPSGEPRAEAVFISRTSKDKVDKTAAEACVVAERLAGLRDQGVAPGDMVVLLRKMSGSAEVFQRELEARGLPVVIASGGTYFETSEVLEVISLLHLADNMMDDQAALVVLAGRLTSLSDDALFALRKRAGRGCLWSAARDAEGLVLPDGDRVALQRTVEAVDRIRSRRGAFPLGATLLDACEWLDYDLTLFMEGEPGVRAWANVLKLIRMADSYDQTGLGDIGGFLGYLKTRRQHVASEQQVDVTAGKTLAVRVMSIHASKGLEFPVVAVAGFSSTGGKSPWVMVSDTDQGPLLGMKIPTPGGENKSGHTLASSMIESQQKLADAQEAKRLLYVACTRAREGLIVCANPNLGKPAEGDALPQVLRMALGVDGADEPAPDGPAARFDGGATMRITRVDPTELEPAPVQTCAVATCRDPRPLEIEEARKGPVRRSPQTVSYSSLAQYRRCGYRFYTQNVLGLPMIDTARRASRPVQSAACVDGGAGVDPLAFGSATHIALQLVVNGVAPSDERIEAICQEHGLGGDSPRVVGETVAGFLGSELGREAYAADRVLRECPLVVPLEGTVLTGSVDLLAWRGDAALIVDYKTGVGELAADEARERFELQAKCYALAALSAGAAEVRVVFVELQRDGRQTEFSYTQRAQQALKAELGGLVAAMARGVYEPLGAYDAYVCAGCPAYGSLCGISGPRRVAG